MIWKGDAELLPSFLRHVLCTEEAYLDLEGMHEFTIDDLDQDLIIVHD